MVESIAEVPIVLFKEDDSAMKKNYGVDDEIDERKRSPSKGRHTTMTCNLNERDSENKQGAS